MTEQKTLTFMEAIAEARKGAVIGLVDGLLMYWDCLAERLKFHSDDMDVVIEADVLDRGYQIVIPSPKQKVKWAKYRYLATDSLYPYSPDSYYKDDADFLHSFRSTTLKWFERRMETEFEVDE